MAYAAGLFDGEGSIGISHDRHGGGFKLSASIANSDATMTSWLYGMFGGAVYCYAKPPHQATHVWKVHGEHARVFLRLVAPFLLTKAERAALIIDQYPLRHVQRRQQRFEVWKQLRRLNQGRGPARRAE